jgi:hypothetical protein
LQTLLGPKLARPKISVHELCATTRSTFGELFSLMHQIHGDQDFVHVVANNDIAFDDSVRLLQQLRAQESVCLTRWNPRSDGTWFVRWNPGSADAWAVRGAPPPQLRSVSFTPGVPLCDLALNAILKDAGYRVLNPCHSIKTYHHHASNYRTVKLSQRARSNKVLWVVPWTWR